MKPSRTDTVVVRPLLPNSRNPAGALAPPLLKHQKSALLNWLSVSNCAPSTQALPLRKSGGDQNIPQPKARTDQNVPQHHKATSEVAKRFMEPIVFRKNPSPILSDNKYSIIEQPWKLTIGTQDRQWTFARTPIGTPSVRWFPGSPSVKIDPPTPEAVSFGFCLMLLYQISDIDYIPKYT